MEESRVSEVLKEAWEGTEPPAKLKKAFPWAALLPMLMEFVTKFLAGCVPVQGTPKAVKEFVKRRPMVAQARLTNMVMDRLSESGDKFPRAEARRVAQALMAASEAVSDSEITEFYYQDCCEDPEESARYRSRSAGPGEALEGDAPLQPE